MEIRTEKFSGPYVPFEEQEFVPKGSITGGRNLRRSGLLGGWKGRLGYSLINTTAVGDPVNGVGDPIKAIFQYTNPIWEDYHLLVQVAGNIRDNTISYDELLTRNGETLETQGGQALLARSSGDPLEQVADMGGSIFSSAGATPGFADVVGEDFIYADGSGAPVVFGGNTPTCNGFLVDDGSGEFNDFGKSVRNSESSTYAVIQSDASVVYYVGSKEIANAIQLTFGSSKNTNSVTATVKAWRSGSWTSVSASDGTSGTVTHDTDGQLSWTAGSDEMRVLNNQMLYWYQVSFSGAPTITHVISCRVVRAAARMTNKWDGSWRYPSTVLFYNGTDQNYTDVSGLVSNTSESQYLDLSSSGTSDFLYAKAPERLAALGILMVQDKVNSNSALIDAFEYWNGTAWTSISFTDSTKDGGGTDSFAQTGIIWADLTEQAAVRRRVGGDDTAGYWIRLSWAAALSADVNVAAIFYASWPDEMPTVDGVVEYNGRGVYWGPFEYPNRLLISPYDRPDQLADLDDSYSPPFGGLDRIKCCGVFGEYLLVLKEKGVFLMSESSAGSFSVKQLTAEVGISSPKSLAIAEVGESNLKKEEVIITAIWEDLDGFYKISYGGNILKISEMVKNYYDPEKSEYIGDANVGNTQGYISPMDGTYRAVLSDRELVYNIKRSEWYPPWIREIPLAAASVIKGTLNQYVVVGGSSNGLLLRIDYGTADYDTDNVAHNIDQRLITRTFFLDETNPIIKGFLRGLWWLLKESDISTDGDLLCYLTLNRLSSSENYSLSSYSATAEYLSVFENISYENVRCFQIELRTDAGGLGDSGQMLNLSGLAYKIEPLMLEGE